MNDIFYAKNFDLANLIQVQVQKNYLNFEAQPFFYQQYCIIQTNKLNDI